MNRLSEQIEKYQEQLRNMTVMDDYDGGAANQLRMVIDDLRKLETTKFSKGWYEKEVKKDEKTP
tara:strand:- start:1125 stop:1316 length:192 start_codon:yes stop_codon:yes gene_type:complete